MKLSIIILNYKTPELSLQCIRSIQENAPDVLHEILLVDNSPGHTLGKFNDLSGINVLPTTHNGGFAYGNNIGIRESTGEYILLLNPDIIVQRDAITTLLHFLETHQDVGMVAPRLTRPDGSLQLSCSRFPDWKMPFIRRTPVGRTPFGKKYEYWYGLHDWNHKTEKDIDWVVGAAMMVRRRAIDDAGLLDEHFFMYVEDIDWCRRFWEKNWRVAYVPQASMIHVHTRASARRNSLIGIFDYPTRLHIKSFLYYIRKYTGKPLPHTMD